MSMSALLRGIRDFLQQDGGFGTQGCRVMATGKPPTNCGDIFVAVHYGYWRDNGSNGESLDEMFGVRVTVTMKSTKSPYDDIGEEIIAPDNNEGIVDICRKIRAMVHCDPRSESGDVGIRQRANQYMKGGQNNAFITGPEFISIGDPQPQGPQWFGGRGGDQAGVSMEMIFGNCNLVQRIEYQDLESGGTDPIIVPPIVSSLVPGTSYISNSHPQTVSGLNFNGILSVKFDGVDVQWFNTNSQSSIRVIAFPAPTTSVGIKNVTVTNSVGTSTGTITYTQSVITNTLSANIVLPSPARNISLSCVSSDRVLWCGKDRIFSVDVNGNVLSVSLGTSGIFLFGICVAGDGMVWMVDTVSKVYRSTGISMPVSFTLDQTDGGATVFPLGMCSGPGGLVYVSGYGSSGNGYLWVVNLDGTSLRHSIAHAAFYGVIVGPDGNLWCYGQDEGFTVGRVVIVDRYGVEVSRHDIGTSVQSVAVAHDGKVWITDGQNFFNIVDPSNWPGATQITLQSGASLQSVCAGPDGMMWISAWFVSADSKVYKLSLTGSLSASITVPGSSTDVNSGVRGIAAGIDGAIYGATFSASADGFAFKIT